VKRFVLVLATLAVVLTAAQGASAQVAKPGFGVKRACKTGPMRCFAMVVTRGGKTLSVANPNVLPTGYGPKEYHKAYKRPRPSPAT
jgi:hypothetical protein